MKFMVRDLFGTSLFRTHEIHFRMSFLK